MGIICRFTKWSSRNDVPFEGFCAELTQQKSEEPIWPQLTFGSQFLVHLSSGWGHTLTPHILWASAHFWLDPRGEWKVGSQQYSINNRCCSFCQQQTTTNYWSEKSFIMCVPTCYSKKVVFEARSPFFWLLAFYFYWVQPTCVNACLSFGEDKFTLVVLTKWRPLNSLF